MRILMVHNHYRQRGGEDIVAEAESSMLSRMGHEVYCYKRNNNEINSQSLAGKARLLWDMVWSQKSYREVKQIIKEFQPDICHTYNTFFMITPSVHYACEECNVPVVQSLYNYRLICANALFLRKGKCCEDCATRSRWRSVFYSCYRNSSILTALVVRMINSHWKKETWIKNIDCYITATEFSRQKFIDSGIHPKKITVKPHFVYPDLEARSTDEGYALYIGRLSNEKGVRVLIDAWRKLKDIPLKIMGEGPLLDELRQIVHDESLSNVEVLGYCPQEEYVKYLKGSRCLIIPSISHDNFPRTIAEAYSCGVPVLVSSLEGMKEAVVDKETGRLFVAGDACDLADKAKWFFSPDYDVKKVDANARREFVEKYTSEKNYEILMDVYDRAIQLSK